MRQSVCLRSLIGSTPSLSRKFRPKSLRFSHAPFRFTSYQTLLPLANTFLAIFQERAEEELNQPPGLPGRLVSARHGKFLFDQNLFIRRPLANCCLSLFDGRRHPAFHDAHLNLIASLRVPYQLRVYADTQLNLLAETVLHHALFFVDL
jgi:hypothetical protein